MKALIFDSGTLINLSMNGLLYILEELKKNFDGKFIITKYVKSETVDRPIGIQKYELGAIQVENLIKENILEMPSSLEIDDKIIDQETHELMDGANHLIRVKDKWIQIVSEAEMSCLAVSKELSKKGIESLIAIDERTTRMICENPSNIVRIMSEKLHQRVELDDSSYNMFSDFKFIRSTELVYVAYKKGLIRLENKKLLEALLYATKFKGSSVSFEEIDVLKKM